MEKECFYIENIPAIIYGNSSKSCYIFIHGHGGNKFEAERFALLAQDYQVLTIDLPGHGERKDIENFVPWRVEKELKKVIEYAKQRWSKIYIRATSIGVYFSLLAFKYEKIEKCLFVSPLLDMQRMILDLMNFAKVTKEQLQEKNEIKTSIGQTLSWEYYCFAKDNPIKAICKDTYILYANGDEVIPQDTVEKFVQENKCNLTIIKGCEHWLHLPNEIKKMEQWEKTTINS